VRIEQSHLKAYGDFFNFSLYGLEPKTGWKNEEMESIGSMRITHLLCILATGLNLISPYQCPSIPQVQALSAINNRALSRSFWSLIDAIQLTTPAKQPDKDHNSQESRTHKKAECWTRLHKWSTSDGDERSTAGSQ